MDTDSFILSFNANNRELRNFLQENKDEFDFSELDKSHEFYDPVNKKVISIIITFYSIIGIFF